MKTKISGMNIKNINLKRVFLILLTIKNMIYTDDIQNTIYKIRNIYFVIFLSLEFIG